QLRGTLAQPRDFGERATRPQDCSPPVKPAVAATVRTGGSTLSKTQMRAKRRSHPAVAVLEFFAGAAGAGGVARGAGPGRAGAGGARAAAVGAVAHRRPALGAGRY